MKWNLSNSMGWALLGAAVLLLGLTRQLDLLLVITPIALIVSYFAARSDSSHNSGERRI